MSESHDTESIVGQDVEEVSSEMTEILKMEKILGRATDSEARMSLNLILINKYIRGVDSVAIRDGYDLSDEESLPASVKSARKLEAEYHAIDVEEIRVAQDILDDRYVNTLASEWDPANPNIVPDIALSNVFVEMNATARLRLMLRVSIIAQRLSKILAPEIDLYRDLTVETESQDEFESRYLDG